MGNLAKLYDVGGNSSNVIGENEPVKICDVYYTNIYILKLVYLNITLYTYLGPVRYVSQCASEFKR